jgi:hypothetical protein
MDPAELAKQVGVFLLPCLPALLAGSQAGLEEAAKKLGKGTVEQAERLWGTLWPKLEGRPAGAEAARDVARAPDREAYRTVLQVQLEKLLAEDPELAAEIEKLFAEAQRSGAVAAAQRSVSIGGDATGNVIITGDQNRVGRE